MVVIGSNTIPSPPLAAPPMMRTSSNALTSVKSRTGFFLAINDLNALAAARLAAPRVMVVPSFRPPGFTPATHLYSVTALPSLDRLIGLTSAYPS